MAVPPPTQPSSTGPVRARAIAKRLAAEGAKVVATLDEAVTLAENVAFIEGQDEAVVMGGAEIYALALPKTDRLYLTEVHAEVDGDTWFPEYDTSEWKEIGREDFPAEGPNPYDYSFVVYERK